MNSLLRRSVQLPKNIRLMSGGHSNAAAEAAQWKKVTFVATAFCAVFTVYNIFAHEHEHPIHGLPYQKIRAKPYPWSCSDCNLFTSECWKECREGKKEESHGH